MAKQAVSWIEWHVEKFVLGITGLLLLVSIGLYGASTPNTIDVGGVKAGPGRLDGDWVRGEAVRLAETLKTGGTPSVEPVPDYAEQWREGQSDVLASAGVSGELPPYRPFGQLVPLLSSIRLPGEKTGLAKILPPGKPETSSGRSTLYATEYLEGKIYRLDVPPPGESEEPPPRPAFKDLSWITVAAMVDVAGQRAAFFNAGYDARDTAVNIYDAQLQRQTRQPDGGWSDWDDVRPYYPYLNWGVPQIRLTRARDGTLQLESDQRKALGDFMALVEDYQCELRMPYFARGVAGDKWMPPRVEGVDWEPLITACGDVAPIPKSFAAPVKVVEENADEKLTPYRRIKKWMTEAEQLTDKWDKAPDKIAENPEDSYRDLREARKLLKQIIDDPDANPVQKRKAEQFLAEKVEPLYNEAVKARDEARFRSGLAEEEEEEGEEGPPLGGGELSHAVVWVHDLGMQPGGNMLGVEPGQTYRYRLRLRLLNTLAGQLGRVQDQEAVEKVLLEGEWSPPSDPVTATKDKEFYFASVDDSGDRARVIVFLRKEGELLDRKFTVGLGEEIGERRVRVKLKDEWVFEDFSTGVTLVDIEPNRTYYRRRERAEGFELDPVKTEAVVLADAGGGLEERLVYLDKQAYSELRKTLEEQKVKPGEAPPEAGGEKGGLGGKGGKGTGAGGFGGM